MLANSGIATTYLDLSILLSKSTEVTKQLMDEIIFIMRVSVRNNAEAYVLVGLTGVSAVMKCWIVELLCYD